MLLKYMTNKCLPNSPIDRLALFPRTLVLQLRHTIFSDNTLSDNFLVAYNSTGVVYPRRMFASKSMMENYVIFLRNFAVCWNFLFHFVQHFTFDTRTLSLSWS